MVPWKKPIPLHRRSLMMSDDEMMEFIKAYGELIKRYMPNKPAEGRKVRKVTFVISPNE